MDSGKFDQFLKKWDAAMFYEMTDREIEAYQRRIAQHELERVERWKQLEAKWKAEEELFFIKYGITQEEALQGKAPKFNHVDCVVPKPPIDVVHVDNVPFEGKTVAVQFVDVLDEHVEGIVAFEELTCPTMEEVVPKAAAVVDIHVVNVVDIHDIHFMEVDTIEEEFEGEESTHVVEIENSHRSDFRVDDLYIVDGGGKPKHTLDDPYLVHVDVSPDLHLSDYLVSDRGFILNYVQPRGCFGIFWVQHGAHNPNAHMFKIFVRVSFDPGIFLGFIVEVTGIKISGAHFYDILLIRGRIIFQPGGNDTIL